MARLKLGIDVDGVLAAFVPSFLEMSRQMFGKPAPDFVQTQWAFDEALSSVEQDMLWDTLRATPNWWLRLKRMPGTESLRRLAERATIFYITTRVPSAGLPVETQTAQWLQRNYDLTAPTVLVAEDSNHKGELAWALRLDAFIDDKPANCTAVLQSTTRCAVYLKDATYNRDFEHPKVERIQCVDNFLAEVIYGAR
jgi:uncharacterized HAD superfamily protein